MKIFYLFLIALLTSSFAFSQSSNYVIVKGHITNTNGASVANWPVYIVADSTTGSACQLTHSRTTNATGNYADTLFCTTNISAVRVIIPNCNNTNLTHFDTVPPLKVVEDNFVICVAGTSSCNAAFTATVSGLTAVFNSAASTASAGSTITQRLWTFGDGSSMTGNTVQPTHTYATAGTYSVHLIIISSSQCRDTADFNVTVTAPTGCHPYFIDSVSGYNVYAYSSNSTTVSGDSIVERHWTFGDGTSLGGNVINPSHTYSANGTYLLCLRINSASGCKDSICKTVMINNVVTSCVSSFTYTHTGNVYTFNSAASQTPAPDVIIRRSWSFGNDTLGGNVVSPTHTYSQPAGWCGQGGPSGNIDYYWKATTSGNVITWTFHPVNRAVGSTMVLLNNSLGNYIMVKQANGDFTYSQNVGGFSTLVFGFTYTIGTGMQYNTIDSHSYVKGDICTSSTVCLTIYTQGGCSKTSCQTINLADTTCHSNFTYTTSGNTVTYTSTATSGAGSAISYYWSFGDSSTSTVASPVHQYASAGTYYVCLTISTSSGCTSTECHTVTIVGPVACKAKFTYTRGTNLTMQFNSSGISIAAGDTVKARRWDFGDGTYMSAGNAVSVFKTYQLASSYNVCLHVETVKRCTSDTCMLIRVGDATAPDTSRKIDIISIFPNPATTQFTAVIWSRYNALVAELAIMDMYGVKKWGARQTLANGNNSVVVPTNFLTPGPYLLRVSTIYGVLNKQFYKL